MQVCHRAFSSRYRLFWSTIAYNKYIYSFLFVVIIFFSSKAEKELVFQKLVFGSKSGIWKIVSRKSYTIKYSVGTSLNRLVWVSSCKYSVPILRNTPLKMQSELCPSLYQSQSESLIVSCWAILNNSLCFYHNLGPINIFQTFVSFYSLINANHYLKTKWGGDKIRIRPTSVATLLAWEPAAMHQGSTGNTNNGYGNATDILIHNLYYFF